jgi:glycosyltransferase involved in cell wall biosynthesis
VSATPRLSIGLPVYNGDRYLTDSLDALLGQTFGDFELIIADNASTDGTADICKHYEKQDSRIRYTRQPHNVGAAPNHNFLFQQSRGELFKWASCDDLYARDLLQRCVKALDDHPEIVLAHSWTAAIDEHDVVTQALEYPLATDSLQAPVRFASLLFGHSVEDAEGVVQDDDYGVIRADDSYGVIRADVMRRVAPHGSYYHSDRVITAEISLYGPFYMVPDWLYFRRDHADRATKANPTVRTWCSSQDPRRANRLRHPAARLFAEFIWAYISAIRNAPLSNAERRECYRYLAKWGAQRTAPVVSRAMHGGVMQRREPVTVAPPAISVDAIVAGREGRHS